MEKHIYKGNFDFIREFVRNEIGMVLEKEKEYLIEYSLKPVYEAEGLKSIGSLVAHLRTSRPGKIHERILDAITINETSFFRDGKPFDALENTLIPKLVSSGALSDGLNIWCAACSSVGRTCDGRLQGGYRRNARVILPIRCPCSQTCSTIRQTQQAQQAQGQRYLTITWSMVNA